MKKKEKDSLEEIQQAIRTSGLRATPARIAILQLLRNASSPLTHADVSKELAGTGVDVATVFRNLNGMAQVGLLRRVELGDHVWRFEVILEEDQEHGATHPHFLCVDCGAVTCLDEVKLTSSSKRATATVGEVTEILVRGHCNACI